MCPSIRIAALRAALKSRVLVLDGAMGTAVQALNLTAADFGGAEYEGCNENLVFTKPDAVREIHRSFLAAGADIVETDTFGGTPLVLAEYGLAEKTFEINRTAATLAREEADRHSTPEKPRFVAGSMGPTTKSISVTGGITFEELSRHFYEQARGLHAGGADYFLVETVQDTRNAKAAVLAIERLFDEGAERIPVALSATIEASGTMLAGQSAEAFYASVAHWDLLYIGLNCATGPRFMADHLRSLAGLSRFSTACVPNAGLPDENGRYAETPEAMAEVLGRFLDSGWVNLIGGCCGTTPAHVAAFSSLVSGRPPRLPSQVSRTLVSGIDCVEISEENRPVLVGERTNAIGSRKFKKLIADGLYDEAVEVGRGQIKNGAQVLDVCLSNPDRNELDDMERFLERAVRTYRVPLMLDSTDDHVFAAALTHCQGKAILNSVNLEDGEKRFAKVVPLARKFGAALVVGTIDEDPKDGMARTRERKLEIARRSHALLTGKYGFPEEDILWDPLVFPCGTGDPKYTRSAAETIDAVRDLKAEFPRSKTLLGISNVSFGLPEAGREVLNSVFLYHCTKAGLDFAIVNPGMLRRYPSIPEFERRLAENLLFHRGPDPLVAFTSYFRSKAAEPATAETPLSVDERLTAAVVEGSKSGLPEALDEALRTRKALDIVNGPLMRGMEEVGRLFNHNELIVAEVLLSAEVMKAAVTHLERFLDKSETLGRGKVILATVKGDVHDIGKNLVEIILANNGFDVVNLGIKVSPEALIAAVKEHQPKMIGLSGLLVKSAHQMVATAEDLARAGIQVPLLVGGAALTKNFVDRRIAAAYGGTVAYASDAMNGLELARILIDPERLQTFRADLEKGPGSTPVSRPFEETIPLGSVRSNVVPVARPPAPPDFDRHVVSKIPMDQVWEFLNLRMLFGRHLGLSNTLIRPLEEGDPDRLREMDGGKKALDLFSTVEAVKSECRNLGLLRPKAVYRFIRASGEGDEILLYDRSSGEALARLSFPRQAAPPYLCLADYLNPVKSGRTDNLCLFVVTAGHGVRETAGAWKDRGDYLRSHILQALALETAEACAEFLHARIREFWGQPGRRYSFGTKACPDLEGQKVLFDLLEPDEIGVRLTETFMMDPEASVSALVFHHPAAVYFSALGHP